MGLEPSIALAAAEVRASRPWLGTGSRFGAQLRVSPGGTIYARPERQIFRRNAGTP
jgi:hypothetical protein